MGKLSKRVVLIHELRQLGASEELLNGSCYRLTVDKITRVCIIYSIASDASKLVTDRSFHSGKSDTVLILKKFTYGTDTSVAKVVDIILCTNSALQIKDIVNRSKYIFSGYMLWNKVIYMIFNFSLKVFTIVITVSKLHNLHKLWIVNKLGNPNFFLVKFRNECIDVNHEV